jgi:hypothetical protein
VRLRERLPSVFSVLTATLLWFIVGERIEPHHAVASLGMTALALALGAYVVRWLANAVAETFARAVITVLRLSFSPRAPSWHRRKRTRPIARRIAWTRRRFARPPPILA